MSKKITVLTGRKWATLITAKEMIKQVENAGWYNIETDRQPAFLDLDMLVIHEVKFPNHFEEIKEILSIKKVHHSPAGGFIAAGGPQLIICTQTPLESIPKQWQQNAMEC